MKNTFLAVILFIAATTASFAQSPLAKGQNQINLGVGLSNWGIPLYFGLDHGVHKDISIGFELSFRNFHEKNNSYTYNHSILGISGNANYHFNSLFNIPSNWDLYAGLNIGFYHFNSSKDYRGSYNSGLGLGAQLGGRYYFTNKFGVNLELGGGNAFSGGKFGITIKL